MSFALISLGSNLGNRRLQLKKTQASLCNRTQTNACALHYISQALDNPAEIVTDQPRFLNQILILKTDETPEHLLRRSQQIENDLGRISRFPYGPREIDIDLLCFQAEVRDLPSLTLPHPALFESPPRKYLSQLLRSPDKLVRQLLQQNHCAHLYPPLDSTDLKNTTDQATTEKNIADRQHDG